MRSINIYAISISSLGAGFIHAWRWSLMYSNIVIPFDEIGSMTASLFLLTWNTTLISCYLLFFLFSGALSRCFSNGKVVGLFSIIGSIGSALIILSYQQKYFSQFAIALSGVILAAIAMSVLIIAWSNLFSHMDYEQVRVAAALFIAFGTVAFLVCSLFHEPFARLASILFPIASFILYQTKDMTTLRVATFPAQSAKTNPIPVFVACLVCLSVANSYMRGLDLSMICLNGGNNGAQLLFNCIVATSLALLFARSQKVLYSISVVSIAGGLGLLSFSEEVFGAALLGSGFICFEILIWMVVTEGSKKTGASVQKIASLVWMGLHVGATVGIALGLLVAGNGGLGSGLGSIVSLILAYCVLVTFVFNFNRSFLDVFDSAPEEGQPTNVLMAKAALYAQAHGFTLREKEVCDILASGRNAKYVAKTLVISDNTVKTHIKNIYRKAGVASKNELLDAISNFTPNSQSNDEGADS